MDYTPLNIHMHVAMWILWFLWFLRVEYSAKRLYKPLCAFLVFVDLVWFLCGSFCGFWSRVVFGSCLARPIHLIRIGGLALDADAEGCPQVLRVHLPAGLARPIHLIRIGGLARRSCASSRSLWVGGLALDADACPWSCGFVVLPSMPMPTIARPIHLMWFWWIGGLSLPMLARGLVVLWSCPRCRCLPAGLCGFVVLPSMPMLARRSLWFCGLVVLHSMPKPMIACPLARRSCASDRAHVVFVGRWSCLRCSMPTIARPLARRYCASSCSLWVGGLALDAEADDCVSTCPQVFVDLWSCASTCPQVLRVRSTSCGFVVGS